MENIRKIFEVKDNRQLTSRTYLMELAGDTGALTAPGQFVNLAVEGKFLRRPISVCDFSEGRLLLLYDVVGEGTEEMSRWKTGYQADVLLPLGNGFDTSRCGDVPLLMGGGIGIAPLYGLARQLLEEGKSPIVFLGFNSSGNSVFVEEFRALDIPVWVSTVDGTQGCKGFVTDALRQSGVQGDYFYACGPMPMLRALTLGMEIPGELSLDERMACGFGVCMCCSLETRDGAKRICKDGPVFRKEELIWK